MLWLQSEFSRYTLLATLLLAEILSMDNHPIPQDVTGFQFKLIGSMTIKQFAYIMAGVILSVILYYFPLPTVFGAMIKIIFIPLFGATGIVLAFVPIEGRPIDVMLANFLKALFAPNQFVYHKAGRLLNFSTTPMPKNNPVISAQPIQNTQSQQQATKDQVQQFLHHSSSKKPTKLDEKEQAFLNTVAGTVTTAQQTVITPGAPQAQPAPAQQQPKPVAATATTLAQQEQNLIHELNEAKKQLTPQAVLQVSSAANQKVSSLERQVQELHFQRQQLEEQLQHLQKQLASNQQIQQAPQQQAPVAQPSPAQTVKPSQPAQVTTQTSLQAIAQKTGLPHVPDTANVIAGIVKDPRGNVLPNMLVEVKDKQGNPVRAFKTNALGQFASATPLSPGDYTVELEDPKKQNTFDIIQLHAANQILLPIEIISHDAREELRKQLFN